MYTMYQRHGSTEYDTEYDTEHYSEMANYAATCPSCNAEYDPESDPESQPQCRYRKSRTRLIFGGATIFKEGMTVPESQQHLPRITVPEVQERSTGKHIHQ
jgi:hypothetical protein